MAALSQEAKDRGLTAALAGSPIIVQSVVDALATDPAQAGFSIGMNFGGGSYAAGRIGTGTDRYGYEYIYGTEAMYKQWAAEGVTHVRLAVQLSRLFPAGGGPLVQAESERLVQQFTWAQAAGIKILLNAHNYFQLVVGGKAFSIGTPEAPVSELVRQWVVLATLVKGNPALYGYGLMNEPNGNSCTAAQWAAAAQLCIDGIRDVDTDATITVAGWAWSTAANWVAANPGFPLRGTGLVYEAHMYVDGNASGTYSDRNENIDPQIGVQRLKPFFDWLHLHNAKGMIGECGCPNTMPKGIAAVANAVAYAAQRGVRVWYWQAGPWLSTSDPTGITANGNILAQWAAIKPLGVTLAQDGPTS